MVDTTHSTSRLYIPALGGIYAALDRFAHPLLRAGFGAIIMTHGLQKVFGLWTANDWEAYGNLFERLGYSPGMLWFIVVAFTELIGGALLVVGAFTRLAAAAFVIFMIVAIPYNMDTNNGSPWFWLQQGAEYSTLILLVSLFLLIKGSGGISVDSAMRREL